MSVPNPEGVSEEFFIRVNDMIEMANRIERRLDTHHAQMVILHAFTRYAAHHYRSTVKQDSERERAEFVTYIGNKAAQMILAQMEQLSGPAPDLGQTFPGQPAAGEPAAE
jgi:hypothetical protein